MGQRFLSLYDVEAHRPLLGSEYKTIALPKPQCSSAFSLKFCLVGPFETFGKEIQSFLMFCKHKDNK